MKSTLQIFHHTADNICNVGTTPLCWIRPSCRRSPSRRPRPLRSPKGLSRGSCSLPACRKPSRSNPSTQRCRPSCRHLLFHSDRGSSSPPAHSYLPVHNLQGSPSLPGSQSLLRIPTQSPMLRNKFFLQCNNIRHQLKIPISICRLYPALKRLYRLPTVHQQLRTLVLNSFYKMTMCSGLF